MDSIAEPRGRLEAAGWTVADATLLLPDGSPEWIVVLRRGEGEDRKVIWAKGYTREDAWEEAERLAGKEP